MSNQNQNRTMNIDQHFEEVFELIEVVGDGEKEVVVEYQTNTGDRARHAFVKLGGGEVERDEEAPYKARAYVESRTDYEFPKAKKESKNTTPQTTLQDYEG